MIPGVPAEALAPIGGIIFVLIIVLLASLFGISIPRWTVRSMLKVKDDQIKLLTDLRAIDDKRYDAIAGMAPDVKVIGETQIRILNALPVPHNEDKKQTGGGDGIRVEA